MALNGSTRSMLNSVALLMVSRQAQAVMSDTDQDGLDFALKRNPEATVAYLAERVAHHSSGQSTVRPADTTLFADQVMGTALHLVLCPSDTPEGVVTELAEGMVLIKLGPYDYALEVGAKRASRT